MESLTPLNAPSSSTKIEVETSKKTPLETELFLKTLGVPGSTTIGTWKDKKFTLSNDIKDIDLQQITVKILKNEGPNLTADEQTLLVKALLDTGVSVDVNDQDQKTLLHHAARLGNLELMKILVERGGVNINARDDIGRTPLSYAAEQGSRDIVKMLLDKGADVNAISDDYTPPSFSLLPTSPNIIPKHQKSHYWLMSPLHYATLQGNEEIAKLLLTAGANPDAVNSEGQTPLYFSVERENVSLTSMLAKLSHSINSPTNRGYTPLILAILTKNEGIIRMLLELGADPNISDNTDYKASPLHHAISFSLIGIAQLLLEKGAKIDAVNAKGDQPIHYSMSTVQTPDSLKLLVSRGADINAFGGGGMTPLQQAEGLGKDAIITALLDLGANPNIVSKYGTAINYSTRMNPQAQYSEETNTLSRECTRRKTLSLRFGISGTSKVSSTPENEPELSLEGYTRSGGVKMVTDTMRTFSPNKNEMGSELSEEAWSEVLNSFNEISNEEFPALSEEKQSKMIDDYLKRLDEGKPIILPTGWEEHTLYMIFIKTKNGILCVDCNRGERAKVQEGGITIYDVVMPQNLNRDALRRILTARDRTFIEFYLPSLLGLIKQNQIGLKDQKSGSCSFTSAKTAVFANLYVFFKNKGLDDSTALAKTKDLYRSWTQFDRAATINAMLDEYDKSPNPPYRLDYHLLFSALSKMKSAAPTHPSYIRARQRLMDFLDKHVPSSWDFNKEVDVSHLSPLSYAVQSQQKDLVELMIKKGADISATDPGNWTPLQRAITQGDKDMVSFLVSHGASLTGKQGQEPPVHTAMRLNRMDMVNSLLKKMKKQGSDLNLPNAYGVPLVHQAALNSRTALDLLFNQGVDLNTRDTYSYTTLQQAIIAGKKESINYLLEKGISLQEDPVNGMSPLLLAIYYDQTDAVKDLAHAMKQQGLSLTSPDTFHGYTPLELAIYKNNTALFDYLQTLGIEWNNSTQSSCVSAIINAASDPENATNISSCINSLGYLLDQKGVDINTVQIDGYRPIDTCFTSNTPLPMIQTIIDRMVAGKQNIHERDASGYTLYELAKYYGREDVCQFIDTKYPKTGG